MAINLIPLKATVLEPDEYVQHCEDNGTKPSLDFEEYVLKDDKGTISCRKRLIINHLILEEDDD